MDIKLKVNNIATIKSFYRFRRISYYTIKIEDEISLFQQFINSHSNDTHREALYFIRAWLSKLGEEIGAEDQYFRFESFRGGASALPPPSKQFKYLDLNINCNLRLYCMRINRKVVILFNGGFKTAQTSQECDNVRPHFLLANKLSNLIDEKIKDKEIRFDDNDDLIFSKDLTLEL